MINYIYNYGDKLLDVYLGNNFFCNVRIIKRKDTNILYANSTNVNNKETKIIVLPKGNWRMCQYLNNFTLIRLYKVD